MSASKNSTKSEGDGFWAKNGPGIMSATGTALSTTYKAGKFVGKSAYSAGKTHYNNQKGNKQEEVHEEKSQSFTPIESLKSVDAFAPPPLKPGQMQYQKGGNTVAAGDKPLARQASYVSVSVKEPSPASQTPSVNSTPVIPPDSLQPLYNAEGQIIGYVPKQGSSNEPPSVGPRPVEDRSNPPPIAPRHSMNTINRDVPPVPVRSRGPVPVPSDNVSINTTNDSGNSDGNKSFEVTPYKYISPEEREKNTKLVIDNKVDVKKVAPPPVHTGRGQKVEKKFSEIVDEKIRGSSSLTPESSQSNLAVKEISANNTSNSIKTDGSSVKAEEVKSPAVLGKYEYEKKLDFQPPPRANVPEGVVLPSARLAQMKEESESKRHAPVNVKSSRSMPPPPPTRSATTSHTTPISKPTANRKPPHPKAEQAEEKKETAKVLGSYDYNKPVMFAPPPTAKRSERDMEFITQKMEKSRITTDKNMRFLQEQSKPRDAGARRKVQVLQPEQQMTQPPPQYSQQLPPKPEQHIIQPPPKPEQQMTQPPPKYSQQPPPKPPKPEALVAPPKPKKPKSLIAAKIPAKSDDNPFERYNPNAAV